MAAKFKYGVKGEDGSEDGTETGTEAGDWIAGLAGDDELHGGGGADTLYGDKSGTSGPDHGDDTGLFECIDQASYVVLTTITIISICDKRRITYSCNDLPSTLCHFRCCD